MPSAQTLTLLIVISVTLDAHSTWGCLRAGHRETNPFLRSTTPAGILRASAILGVVLIGALVLTLIGESKGSVSGETGLSVRYVLSAVSITKLIAAFENYLLWGFGRNLATLLFPGLRRRRNIVIDLLVTMAIAVIPALIITRLLYPAFE